MKPLLLTPGVFVLLVTLCGCAVPTRQGEFASDNPSDPPLTGESVDPKLPPPFDGPIFPHIATWREPKVHGAYVRLAGKDICRQCHGANFEGGAGQACNSCHVHPADWKNIDQHPKKFTEQLPIRNDTNCMLCHGKNYQSDLSPVACNDCHNGKLSHIGDWRNRSQHGERYRTMKTQPGGADCFSCHNAPFDFDRIYDGVDPSPVPPPQCYECHPAYPHTNYRLVNRRGIETVFPWSNSRAHVTMITNSGGLLPRGNGGLDDLILKESLQQTCGQFGGCHTGGRGSSAKGAKTRVVCTEVCHTFEAATPW